MSHVDPINYAKDCIKMTYIYERFLRKNSTDIKSRNIK